MSSMITDAEERGAPASAGGATDELAPEGGAEPVPPAVLAAACSLYRANRELAELDAEGRAVARLAAEALMRGDVSRAALSIVARVEGRAGILALLRGSAESRPS